MGNIFVLHENEEVRRLLSDLLASMGHKVESNTSISNGIELIKKTGLNQSDRLDLFFIPDHVMSVSNMPSLYSRNFSKLFVDHIVSMDEPPEYIVLGQGEVPSQDKTYFIENGAFDYIRLPLRITSDTSAILQRQIIDSIDRAFALIDGSKINIGRDLSSLIGNSWKARRIKYILNRAISNHMPILINSEPGGFPTFLAQIIHKSSSQKSKRYYEINCNESEITQKNMEVLKLISFCLLDGSIGTIGLLEIGGLPMQEQTVLISAVDSYKEESDLPRLIFTSTSDLKKIIDKGQFQEELLRKINTLEINLPPLRERKKEISRVADIYLNLFRELLKLPKQFQISKETSNILAEYPWPGNEKELSDVLRVAVVNLGKKTVLEPSHLPLKILTPLDAFSSKIFPSESKSESKSNTKVISRKEYMYYKSEKSWKIGLGDNVKDFPPYIGFNFIHILLQHPNEPIPCGTLYSLCEHPKIGHPEKTHKLGQIYQNHLSIKQNPLTDKRTSARKAIERALKEISKFPEISKVLNFSTIKTGGQLMYHPEFPMPKWNLMR